MFDEITDVWWQLDETFYDTIDETVDGIIDGETIDAAIEETTGGLTVIK